MKMLLHILLLPLSLPILLIMIMLASVTQFIVTFFTLSVISARTLRDAFFRGWNKKAKSLEISEERMGQLKSIDSKLTNILKELEKKRQDYQIQQSSFVGKENLH